MILLTTTGESVEVVTGGAGAVDYIVSWVDITTSALTPGSGDGAITTATTTTIVAAPGASTSRQIKGITIRNTDAAANAVVVRKDNSGSSREFISATLALDESLHFTDTEGWVKIDANGQRQCAVSTVAPVPSWVRAPHFATNNLTATKTLTSGSCFAVYLGKAPYALSQVRVRLRVTTAAATITWAEVAVAIGGVNVGTNPSLTVLGYSDVSAVINSTGQKTVLVSVSAGRLIAAGEDVWVVIGNSATTAGVVRAQSIADDLQVGVQASVAQRPSTILGTPTAFTIEGATTLAPWVALGF
jgi:hypothetical protein